MNDLISRQELLESIEKVSVKGNVLDDDWVYRFVQEFPSIDAVPTESISRIEKELHGRDVEMQYEIIRWLWNYGKQFTDSRTAILQWLRGEES